MRTIIVNSNAAAKENFSFCKGTMDELEVIQFFDNAEEAVKYVEQNPVDLAIMDTQMLDNQQSGLGGRLKVIQPDIIFIYVNSSNQKTINILKLNVISYFLKQLTPKNLPNNPMDTISYHSKKAEVFNNPRHKRVYARTFGHFDLFLDGQPILFQNRKAKELLALLIDRHGSTVTTEQAISILWEDRPSDTATRNLCNKVGQSLFKKLDCLGIGDIIIKERGIKSIDVNKIDCDMYNLLDGSQEINDRFFGDYMMEYSWAEVRIHSLWQIQDSHKKNK